MSDNMKELKNRYIKTVSNNTVNEVPFKSLQCEINRLNAVYEKISKEETTENELNRVLAHVNGLKNLLESKIKHTSKINDV